MMKFDLKLNISYFNKMKAINGKKISNSMKSTFHKISTFVIKSKKINKKLLLENIINKWNDRK